MVATTIYELRIVHVKPEFILEFYPKLLETSKLYEKFGGKTIGLWIAEGGEVGTYYTLREYASISARVAAREKMWNDSEFRNVYKETFYMVRHIESFLCHAPLSMPVNVPNTKSHVVLHKMRPKKTTICPVIKYRELAKDMNEMIGRENVRPIATLFPLVYNEFCVITIWEITDSKLDVVCERFLASRRDSANLAKIAEYQENFEDLTRVLASPIEATRAPRL